MVPTANSELTVVSEILRDYVTAATSSGGQDSISSVRPSHGCSERSSRPEVGGCFSGETRSAASRWTSGLQSQAGVRRNTASRWLGVRMVALGVTIVGVASSLSVVFRRTLTSGVVGLTISYALDVTENLNWLVRMTGDLETDAASIERIDEYSRLASEANSHCTLQPAPCWPLLGRIQYLNVTASHSPLSPPVLRGLNFTIQPGEKVGLVGRTGAGKTSLWSVLIGLLTPTGGAVVIDGLDVCTVPIHVLRSRVAVLPQEPFVLEGSIRLNLDPTGQINDEQMWEALRKVRLAKHIRSLPKGLDTQCQSDGSIFSTGQKQLLCLARLLLRPAKIVVLDEATSSVDAKTAAVIDQTLIHACAKRTVLVVAHRLSTILNCNRVIVLDKGSVVEMDTPARLMANPLSFFSRLAASSGLMNPQSSHPRQLVAP
ncbi:hypothetical protein C0Q70_11853 [Pomacea canaliculata]|uniref:ABC transporter domain-containing protein n=1 Tax=Pomacea canaliculata TaxID=400727 RepID=A0A2T7P788_POMCA|nr:canalicular multispecific organic anion transporter 1-like [Pomacea canaliculata]PVD29256.1 hypothetical protein C0Q70_11853 [Pomacea canaliculata]